ncbi:MAG: NADH-quinone oxidoreductase subunit NuoE [bacterium]
MTDEKKQIISDDLKNRMQELGNRYPDFKSAIIPALWLVQNEFGYINDESVEEIARVFNVPPVHVQSVLSFYTMYHNKPVGKHLIQLCRSVSCMLVGSDELQKKIEDYLKIIAGETTSDGVFTLITVECLGACGDAPIIQFDNDYHEKMTWEMTKDLIDKSRNVSRLVDKGGS